MSRVNLHQNIRGNHKLLSTQTYLVEYMYTITKVIIDIRKRSYKSRLSLYTFIKYNLSHQVNIKDE